jgi:hypothetical protein
MLLRVAAALLALVALSSMAQEAAAQAAGNRVAVLQGLDKVTGRISAIRAPLNEPVRFGTLLITARSCNKRPPEEPPETTVFLEVYDLGTGGTPKLAYSGWMFASSPALAAMEHPVYDLSVTGCEIPGAR